MTVSKKPVLYNGFRVKNNLFVKCCVERIFFTEIYKLSDERYLYLFLNVDSNMTVTRNTKYNIFKIKNVTNIYVGVIMEFHDKDQLFLIYENLTGVKGLECVAGMKSLKDLLISDVINPFRNPTKFKKFKVAIPNGIILHGPPGCGKTFIVRKLAEELDCSYFVLISLLYTYKRI